MSADAPVLYTVGHGTLSADGFTSLLRAAGIAVVVDVRRHPGSRRHPHFGRHAMEEWLPAAGIAYRWEERLGGRRRGRKDSPNTGLRDPSFRAYADHMAGSEFRDALDAVLIQAGRRPTAVMCSESLWWRCHRRLLADAAVLLGRADVQHLGHDGRLVAHELTDAVRVAGDGLRYDDPAQPTLPVDGPSER